MGDREAVFQAALGLQAPQGLTEHRARRVLPTGLKVIKEPKAAKALAAPRVIRVWLAAVAAPRVRKATKGLSESKGLRETKG